jgi:hypothetical protein
MTMGQVGDGTGRRCSANMALGTVVAEGNQSGNSDIRTRTPILYAIHTKENTDCDSHLRDIIILIFKWVNYRNLYHNQHIHLTRKYLY